MSYSSVVYISHERASRSKLDKTETISTKYTHTHSAHSVHMVDEHVVHLQNEATAPPFLVFIMSNQLHMFLLSIQLRVPRHCFPRH